MIVIYFHYILCSNVLLYFSGFNIMCILMSGPGCRAAVVTTTEDAYAYDEEGTEVETWSPEVTDPARPGFLGKITRGFEKPRDKVKDINKVEEIGMKKLANSSDLNTTLVMTTSTTLTTVTISDESTKASESTTKPTTSTTVTIPNTSSKANESTTKPTTFTPSTIPDTLTKTNESMTTPTNLFPDTSTKANESTTKPTTSTTVTIPVTSTKANETTTKPTTSTTVTIPDTSTRANESTTLLTTSTTVTIPDTSTKTTESTTTSTTMFPDSSTKTNKSTTMPTTFTPSTIPDTLTKTNESMTMPTNLFPDTSTKANESTTKSTTSTTVTIPVTSTKANETTTKPTTSTTVTIPDTSTKTTESTTTSTTMFPDSSTKTNESTTMSTTSTTVTFPHTSIDQSDIPANESETQPFTSDQSNNTIESTAPPQKFTSELSRITNSSETPLENNPLLPTILDEEEANNLLETGTEPLVEYLESTKSDNETFYEELALEPDPTTPPPKYEEGYYDPKKAPTRYGQLEEALPTKPWQYAQDHGIGMRDYNLILYAVNNSAVLEKGSLLNYVYFVFREVLNVNMTLLDIRYCRYLRSKNQENTKKVPPVLVAFTRMEVKNEVLHKRKLLKPTNIKVEHDMPRKILDEQNALLKPLMDKYRAMGQYVVVRSGKLLVEGKVLTEIYLPEKYTYDPLQTFESYISTTVKTTTPGIEVPPDLMQMQFDYGDKQSGRKKKGGKMGGAKKKRKPMIRIPLDEEIGEELSVEVLFTTKKFLW